MVEETTHLQQRIENLIDFACHILWLSDNVYTERREYRKAAIDALREEGYVYDPKTKELRKVVCFKKSMLRVTPQSL